MRILGLDYETCGTPEKPPFLPTEICMIRMDVPEYRVQRTYSAVINAGVEVRPDLKALTHLTQDQINAGSTRELAAEFLYDAIDEVDAVLTWNGDDFDKPLARQELMQYVGKFPEHVPWIDLKIDLGYRHAVKLAYAAADLGYLNPNAHSALGDVLTLFEVARRSNFHYADAIYNAQFPYIEVLAQVGPEKKDLANEVGYRWVPERRIWMRKIRENLLEAEVGARPFVVSRVPTETVKEPISKGTV